MRKEPIVVQDYNPEWAECFRALKRIFAEKLNESILRIEHVGSTSIPGMKAKPVIDLDIIIDERGEAFDTVVEGLKRLGYRHVGDLGITGREAFKRLDETVPDDGSDRTWMKHNLYVCQEGSIGLANHLNFRDYLRNHPDKVIEYSKLKQDLADKFPFDIDAYIDGKTDFIVDVLNRCGMKSKDMELIAKENKIDCQS